MTLAADRGIPILEVPRTDLDRMSANGLHQGIALQVPPYGYAHPDDLLASATRDAEPALIVALDNISDPRNLGAIVRSVAAFAGARCADPATTFGVGDGGGMAHQRRCGRTGSGRARHQPHPDAQGVVRRRPAGGRPGCRGRHPLDEFDASGPLVVVVGSEGKGLSRLVRQTCDVVVSIPMAGPMESLNASVAAGVVLAEIARQRRR